MSYIVFQYLIIISCGILSALLCLYVFFSSRKNLVNRLFSFLGSGIAIWNLGFSLLFFFKKDIFTVFTLEGGLIIAVGLFLFSGVFPAGKLYRKNFLFLIPAIIVSILIPFNFFISGITVTSVGYIVPHNERLFPLYALTLILYVSCGIFFLIRRYFQTDSVARIKIKYFLAGVIIFMVSGLIFDVILSAFGIFELNLIGPIASLFFVAGTVYGIFRHQLLDIHVIIQRGLIYLVLFGFIVIIYIGSLQTVGYFLGTMSNLGYILSASIPMFLGIIFFRPFENYFQKITDHIFFKGKYNYADTLQQLSKILNTNLSQTDIVSASSLALKEIFRTAEVNFCLSEVGCDAMLISSQTGSISVPIVFENQRIGAIELGPKLSGDSYNNMDLQLLQTFACQAAVAIEKGRLYEKIERYNIELEHRVLNRTAEIKKLQEEQKQIMIDISHNLQTPITIIKGELESLFGLCSEKDKEKIFIVEKSLTRVSVFIRQLLRLARLESSFYDVDFSKINLSLLILGQIEYFEVVVKEDGINIVSDISLDINILGNKQLLEEVLTNLVSNAIKYRNENIKSVITISLKEMDQSIQLSVCDNGIGMMAEDIPKIFTYFYRANSSRLSHGSGLGLAIVERIVLRHKGTITVSSILGKGTEFTISLSKIF